MHAFPNSKTREPDANRARPSRRETTRAAVTRAQVTHIDEARTDGTRTDETRVSGCTCFRVRRLARRVTQIYDRVLAPSGLRVTQFSLLSVLARNAAIPGAGTGAVAIGPLAAALDMDRTTLTRNLKPLIDARLVLLTKGKSDARQREASLTKTGRARHEDAKKLWRRAQDDINRTLGATQVASLHQLFDGLLETLNGKAS